MKANRCDEAIQNCFLRRVQNSGPRSFNLPLWFSLRSKITIFAMQELEKLGEKLPSLSTPVWGFSALLVHAAAFSPRVAS